MRLIDVDKLLDDMKKELEKAVNDENLDKAECMVIMTSAIALKDFVNRQPTAYDFDKVVSELEDYKMWKELLIYDLDFRERQIIKRALEIVWKGGIDENKKIIKVLKFLRKYCDSQYSCCDCEFIGMGCDRAFNGFNIERIEKELKDIETLKVGGIGDN